MPNQDRQDRQELIEIPDDSQEQLKEPGALGFVDNYREIQLQYNSYGT